jgi:predicted transcriptional regulator
MEKIPESPKQELLVTIAGPLVNAFIALLLYFTIPVKELMHLNFTETFEVLSSFSIQNFIFYLFIVNIALLIFNLIPAFPMDGGRILRAFLATKTSRIKATQIASTIGQIIAVILFLIGLLYNPFLVFIALFIFLGAYGENELVHHLELLKGHSVEEAMLINITVFNPDDSIDLVVNKIISGTENNFVVVKDSIVVGLLYHKDIIDNSNKNILVKDIMDTNFKVLKSSDDLKKVYYMIQSKNKSFFPVVDNNKLIGAIDNINLNEYVLLQSKLSY